jgi:hypothetical protein
MKDNTHVFRTLEQLQEQKDNLQKDIQADDKQIKSLWSDLFYNNDSAQPTTPTKRFTSIMSTGAGILDGILLGWKLYRRFARGGRYFRW